MNLSSALLRSVRVNFNSYQQIRNLPRWNHRHPVQVLTAEETKDDQLQTKFVCNEDQHLEYEAERSKVLQNVQTINWRHPVNNNKQNEVKFQISHRNNEKPLTLTKQKRKPKTVAVDMLQTIIDKDGNFIYTKMKDNDSRVGKILVEVKSKKDQEKKNLILLEGKRLIKDALQAKCKLEYILFSRIKEVEYLRPFLPKLGAVLYKMPYNEMQLWSELTTNPGIMGVFKKPESENYICTNPIPVTVICDNIREPNNLGAILRVCSGVGCEKVILTKGCANAWESKVLRSAAGAHFRLQIQNKLSWNDIKNNVIKEGNSVFLADNRLTSSESPDLNNLAKLIDEINVVPYYGADFATIVKRNNIILIVGGETEGLSEEAYGVCSERQGVRLNIPLGNDVESLNSGTALGIIAFEIKRQLSIFNKENKLNKDICN